MLCAATIGVLLQLNGFFQCTLLHQKKMSQYHITLLLSGKRRDRKKLKTAWWGPHPSVMMMDKLAVIQVHPPGSVRRSEGHYPVGHRASGQTSYYVSSYDKVNITGYQYTTN